MTKKKIRLTMSPVGVGYEADRQEMARALTTYRMRNGLTQQEAGEKMGVSRYTIMRVEGAKEVHWRTAYRIFAALSELLRQEGGSHE